MSIHNPTLRIAIVRDLPVSVVNGKTMEHIASIQEQPEVQQTNTKACVSVRLIDKTWH